MDLKKIIAIGGGHIGAPGFPEETTRIDKEIVNLTGRKNPRLLFVPTASLDSESYYKIIKRHFGRKLGCKTRVQYLIDKKTCRQEIEDNIFSSDIIYIGGGNTLKMMEIWKKTGVDEILKKACEKGVVLSGLSAGSICFFKWGHSDSAKSIGPDSDYIKISGLGLVNALHCPHYDVEKGLKPSLRKMMRKTSGVAIAIDNCCAIEILGDSYRIISSKPSANAYKTYWNADRYHEEVIEKTKELKPLKELLRK